MEKIKTPSIADMFYPSDKKELIKLIGSFKESNPMLENISSRAVIVPHAGLIYSGKLAYEGINLLDKNIKTIFIFAPAHKVWFEGLGLTSFDWWETPLGKIKINQEICAEIKEKYNADIQDNAIAPEHALEIQVPVIQSIFDENIQIVPILIAGANYSEVADIIAKYYPNKEFGFVISSDLSHFLPNEDAQKVDAYTASLIESGEYEKFRQELACGAIGICGLLKFCSENSYSMIRINMTNSGKVSGDMSRVVGYGCWILYEGNKNDYLLNNYSEFLLDICKTALKVSFTKEKTVINYPQVLDQSGACFVTLEKNGNLRGCIGSIVAYRSLIQDLVEHSKDAAFNDHRFHPVAQEELKDIKISISLLSEPKKIEFSSEKDLLDKIQPYEDGIIIKDGQYQAVYLPSVWEQLPDKILFLNSLKNKAGLPSDYFSETFEAYRFKTSYIKEK